MDGGCPLPELPSILEYCVDELFPLLKQVLGHREMYYHLIIAWHCGVLILYVVGKQQFVFLEDIVH